MLVSTTKYNFNSENFLSFSKTCEIRKLFVFFANFTPNFWLWLEPLPWRQGTFWTYPYKPTACSLSSSYDSNGDLIRFSSDKYNGACVCFLDFNAKLCFLILSGKRFSDCLKCQLFCIAAFSRLALSQTRLLLVWWFFNQRGQCVSAGMNALRSLVFFIFSAFLNRWKMCYFGFVRETCISTCVKQIAECLELRRCLLLTSEWTWKKALARKS